MRNLSKWILGAILGSFSIIASAQQNLNVSSQSVETEIKLESSPEGVYTGSFTLVNDYDKSSTLMLNFDESLLAISSKSFSANINEDLIQFINSLPITLSLKAITDQLDRVPIILSTEKNDVVETLFQGYWTNPEQKKLQISSPNHQFILSVSQDSLKDGGMTQKLVYTLENESAADIDIKPIINGQEQPAIKIKVGDSYKYRYDLEIDVGDSLEINQEVKAEFQNTRFEDITYKATPINVKVIVRPSQSNSFSISKETIILILQVVILLLLFWVFLVRYMSVRKGKKEEAKSVDNDPPTAEALLSEGGGKKEGKKNKHKRKVEKEEVKDQDGAGEMLKINHIATVVEDLKESHEKALQKMNDIVDQKTIEDLLYKEIEQNNELLIKELLDKLAAKRLIKTKSDFHDIGVMDSLKELLNISELDEAEGVIKGLRNKAGDTNKEEILWDEGVEQFRVQFKELSLLLSENDLFASSRVSDDEFSSIQNLEKVLMEIESDEILSILTKLVRITCWSTRSTSFDNKPLLMFLNGIDKNREELNYARKLIEGALVRKGYELIVPKIFEANPSDPNTYVDAPAAPVMQDDWSVFYENWQLEQGTVYDIFLIGIRKSNGEIIQKPIVSRIP